MTLMPSDDGTTSLQSLGRRLSSELFSKVFLINLAASDKLRDLFIQLVSVLVNFVLLWSVDLNRYVHGQLNWTSAF